MTRDEAKALYQRAIDAGYSDEEAKAAISKRLQAAPAPEPVQEEAASEPDSMRAPIKRPIQAMEEGLQGNMGQRFGAGLQRANEGMSEGVRKLFTQLTGGDTSPYEQREQNTREVFEKYDPTGSGISAADLGQVVGNSIPAAFAPAGYLGAAGAGAATGAVQPTVEGESQLFNTVAGALGGLGGEALGRLGVGLYNGARRRPVDEALEDFTERALGTNRATNQGPNYAAVTDAVEGQRQSLADALGQRYRDVEGSATAPVSMANASGLGQGQLSLPEEVMNSLNPGAARTMAALQRGSTSTSPIVDQAGNAIQLPRDVSFTDVRDTVRALRGAKRALPHTDAGIARGMQIDNIIDRLDQDLSAWGSRGNQEVLDAARQVDADYARQVGPFNNRDSVLGSLRRGAGDEGAINRLFMGNDKGQAVSELLEHVPQAREPARALYGAKLLTDRGDTAAMRQLEGGTTAEALLSPQERAYTKVLADNLRKNKSKGMLDMRTLLRGAAHAPVIEHLGGSLADRMTTGVLPYGKEAMDPTIISKILRGLAASQASGE